MKVVAVGGEITCGTIIIDNCVQTVRHQYTGGTESSAVYTYAL